MRELKVEDKAELFGQFIDLFDDFLEERNVRVPTSDKEMKENDDYGNGEARIYGSDYDELLRSGIEVILDNWDLI